MKDALIFYVSCTQGVALGWYILPLQGADDGLHSLVGQQWRVLKHSGNFVS